MVVLGLIGANRESMYEVDILSQLKGPYGLAFRRSPRGVKRYDSRPVAAQLCLRWSKGRRARWLPATELLRTPWVE